MELTHADVFRREIVFRWILILTTLLFLQFGKKYTGGDINYAFAYVLCGCYAACNVIYVFWPHLFSYKGRLGYLVAAVDFTAIFMMIVAAGGVQTNFYLMLGILPLIAGAYFGVRGALFTGALELVCYTLVVLLSDTSGIPDLSTLLAMRYSYIIGSIVLYTYITSLMINDRHKLKMLYKISQGGSSSPALTSVVESIASEVAHSFKVERVLVYLRDGGSGVLSLQLPAYGIPENDLSSFASAARSLSNIEPSPTSPGALVLQQGTGSPEVNATVFPPYSSMRNVLIAPLLARGRNIGFMVLCNKTGKRRFHRRDARLLELVSSHVSVYLENAVLYRSSEENVAQLTSLIRVVDAIGTVSSIDHIYNLALDVVRGLFAADMALINIINHETGLLEPVRSFGFSEKYRQRNISHPFEKIESCYVLTGDRAFLSDDVTHDRRCPNLRVDTAVKSVLCVPIKSSNTAYGILHMASRYQGAFTQNDATLANAIGEQVGMAVERAQLFDEINRLAITDALTGLYNRRYLANILEEEVKRSDRYSHPLSFIMIDIDHFKYYNDRHGHPMGDEVLRSLARLLRDSVRDVDTVFRYGGEEFSVLAPELDKEDVSFLAERLRKVVRDHRFPFEDEQPEGDLTISIGVASFPDDASDGAELIQRSDQALYLAKRQGRDRVSVYAP